MMLRPTVSEGLAGCQGGFPDPISSGSDRFRIAARFRRFPQGKTDSAPLRDHSRRIREHAHNERESHTRLQHPQGPLVTVSYGTLLPNSPEPDNFFRSVSGPAVSAAPSFRPHPIKHTMTARFPGGTDSPHPCGLPRRQPGTLGTRGVLRTARPPYRTTRLSLGTPHSECAFRSGGNRRSDVLARLGMGPRFLGMSVAYVQIHLRVPSITFTAIDFGDAPRLAGCSWRRPGSLSTRPERHRVQGHTAQATDRGSEVQSRAVRKTLEARQGV